jgi:hypothetical protein
VPSGFSDCDSLYASGCEHADLGQQKCCDCTPPSTGSCVASTCTITVCNSGFSDCDKLAANGCEYDNSLFPSDPIHCGRCDVVCVCERGRDCVAGTCTIGTHCNRGYVNRRRQRAERLQVPSSGPRHTTCDGVDDDCNGLVDDGYVPAACGQGL